jgi:vacuolar-type H+-ATPase subunit I/STV1
MTIRIAIKLFEAFIFMNKIFFISTLLSVFTIDISPIMAEFKLMTNKSLVHKVSYLQKSETILITGLGDFIKKTGDAVRDVTGAVDDVDQTIEDMQNREIQQREREQKLKERQAREEERKKREEELAAARKAATERQIEEAERRRQYFDSLSPEEKQAYINQQQALRQKQVEANLLVLGLLADFLIVGNE